MARFEELEKSALNLKADIVSAIEEELTAKGYGPKDKCLAVVNYTDVTIVANPYGTGVCVTFPDGETHIDNLDIFRSLAVLEGVLTAWPNT